MIFSATTLIVETPYGRYAVNGLDRFAIAGDVKMEIRSAVAAHVAHYNAPPDALTWDDAVFQLKPSDLVLQLMRIFVPPRDPFLVAALSNEGRAAIRIEDDVVDTDQRLAEIAANGAIAHVPGLLRFIGWPESAPLRAALTPHPKHRANTISLVINYRDKAAVTIACLSQVRLQQLDAALEIILVDNRSTSGARAEIEVAVQTLFARQPRTTILHMAYDAEFNHSAQCNQAAAMASGEVLVMLSNDCMLLSQDLLQTLADWALEPGVGCVGPRIVGDGGAIVSAGISIAPQDGKMRLEEAPVNYLSQQIRESCGASFACAAVAQHVWRRANGADATAFPTDYNDADFALRLTAMGLRHLYVGRCEAYHRPARGAHRTRERTELIHEALAVRHGLQAAEQRNPYAKGIKRLPAFSHDAANELCDFLRFYRLAVNARNSDQAPSDPQFLQAFEGVIAELDMRSDLAGLRAGSSFTPERRQRLMQRMRTVCDAYARIAPGGEIPARYRSNISRSGDALERLAALAYRPADGQAPWYFSDPDYDVAPLRLLIFADRLGPAQRIAFLENLRRARRDGQVAVRIVAEADLATDRAMESLARAMTQSPPGVCIFSGFAQQHAYAALGALLATPAFGETARLLHLTDIVPAMAAGANNWLQARLPRRQSVLDRIALDADLVVAADARIAEHAAPFFGRAHIVWPDPPLGARPDIMPGVADAVVDTSDILVGFAGSALPRGLPGGLAVAHLEESATAMDLTLLAAAMRGRGWHIGIAPDGEEYLWAAYTLAGIPTLALGGSKPGRLARHGAIAQVGPEGCRTALAALATSPARRMQILEAANRLLAAHYRPEDAQAAMLNIVNQALAIRRQYKGQLQIS